MPYIFRGPRAAAVLILLALLLSLAPPGAAQAGTRTFPETGQTVGGLFLTYWDGHGGLPQQGYPISSEINEVSDLDGHTYTVQYFERAVFERHPENAGTPFEVLLAQLGTYQYRAKYPDGAPDQHASPDNARLFAETGKHLGGKFRAYWESHGGLAQQGYPISEEFTEVDDLNGHSYTVQYFERAVFQWHPENAGTPFEVLLAQLGTFRYHARYQQPPASPTVAPTETPNPACADVPPAENMTLTPPCGVPGPTFGILTTSRGLRPGERVTMTLTEPDGAILDIPTVNRANEQGIFGFRIIYNDPIADKKGIYKLVIEGQTSHARATGYFKILAP